MAMAATCIGKNQANCVGWWRGSFHGGVSFVWCVGFIIMIKSAMVSQKKIPVLEPSASVSRRP